MLVTAKIIIFLLFSGVILRISWVSLPHPRSHGFFRAFAWEIMLVLFLLNLDKWFRDPLSPFQIISWLLLVICIFPAGLGVWQLSRMGKPDASRSDTPMMSFEKTTQLVTTGIYRSIRHPLYSSLLLLNWGIFFKDPTWLGIILALAATLFLVATAKTEEGENLRFFGPEYRVYMERTRMFIPFIF